jgi:excisionase family DNA binding protein
MVAVADRVFLRIPEAAEYIGLPEGYLRRLIREKKLAAITEGVRGWRIRRQDLDKL